jgi:hypothetical protein
MCDAAKALLMSDESRTTFLAKGAAALTQLADVPAWLTASVADAGHIDG